MTHARRTASIAVTAALVVQSIRVALPLLYDVREDAGEAQAVVWALVALVIGPAALVPTIRRLSRGMDVRVVVPALAGARVAEQLIHPIPMWLGALGTSVGLAALLIEFREARSERLGATTAVAVVAGLALDTVLLGVFETWDVVWQGGFLATAAGVVLPLAAVALTWTAAGEGAGERRADAWPMLLLGPFLLLQVLFFQNVAFATSETGASVAGGIAFVLLGQLAGILAGAALVTRPHGAGHLAAGIVLIGAVAAVALVDGASVAVAQPVGSAAAAAVLTIALASTAARNETPPRDRSVAWFTFGMVLFVAFAFAYQIDIDFPLPVPRAAWPIAMGGLLAAGAIRSHRPTRVPLTPAVVPVIGALVVPLVLSLEGPADTAVTTGTATYRLLSWNIHTAVDGDGQIALGEIAEVIEAAAPDIVVLQEVGRGWPIAGQADDLEWLSRRLGMPYVWAPAADRQFGNAVLSVYPLAPERIVRLPYGEGPQDRSAIGVTVGVDPGLFVVGVHLQHGDRPATRGEQVAAVLETWGETDAWVLAGDLNMQPDEQHVERLEDAGLVSAQDLIGDPGASTVRDPERTIDRIDWIWVSASLDVSNFTILQSDASDHLPLVVDITP